MGSVLDFVWLIIVYYTCMYVLDLEPLGLACDEAHWHHRLSDVDALLYVMVTCYADSLFTY